jgi:hypothetical protein
MFFVALIYGCSYILVYFILMNYSHQRWCVPQPHCLVSWNYWPSQQTIRFISFLLAAVFIDTSRCRLQTEAPIGMGLTVCLYGNRRLVIKNHSHWLIRCVGRLLIVMVRWRLVFLSEEPDKKYMINLCLSFQIIGTAKATEYLSLVLWNSLNWTPLNYGLYW